METKELIKKLSFGATIFLVLVGAGLVYWLYTVVYSSPPVDQNKSQQIKLNYELYTKIENPPVYGTSVSPEESGYGRTNPFVPYKAPPAPAESTTGTVAATPST